MAFTQAQLDALEEAISKGVRVVQYADQQVTYYSMDQMLKLRQRMLSELDGNSTTGRHRSRLASVSKGL